MLLDLLIRIIDNKVISYKITTNYTGIFMTPEELQTSLSNLIYDYFLPLPIEKEMISLVFKVSLLTYVRNIQEAEELLGVMTDHLDDIIPNFLEIIQISADLWQAASGNLYDTCPSQ